MEQEEGEGGAPNTKVGEENINLLRKLMISWKNIDDAGEVIHY